MTKSYKKWFIVFFITMLLIYSFHQFVSQKIVFVEHTDRYFQIQDYAYYIIMAKAFWFKDLGNIYNLNFQQQALSAYVGSHINMAMPLGITPIALVVWFPFAYVASFNMALSYTLWMVFSVSVLFTALWRMGRYVFKNKNPQLLPITLSLITVCSAAAFYGILLGQTSLLAAGLLVHLLFFVHNSAHEQSKLNINFFILLIIFILGIKPTYLALGLGILIIYGMWREVIYSLIILTSVLIGLTPMLSVKWILSYFHQLTIFGREKIPDVYAWAFVPDTMNIFRSAFRNFIGDNIAGVISSILTCGTYISVIGFSILTNLKSGPSKTLSSERITKEQLFIAIIGSYLLFSPYAGGYEDILLISVFATVALVGNSPNLINYKSIVLVCILLIILSHNALPLNKPLWLFWIFKAILLGSMLYFCRFQKEKSVPYE